MENNRKELSELSELWNEASRKTLEMLGGLYEKSEKFVDDDGNSCAVVDVLGKVFGLVDSHYNKKAVVFDKLCRGGRTGNLMVYLHEVGNVGTRIILEEGSVSIPELYAVGSFLLCGAQAIDVI